MNVDFVDWNIDDQKHVIDVTVRLDVWIANGPHHLMLSLLEKAFRATEQKWHVRFKCYDFRLHIDWRVVPSLSQVRPNALDVRISDKPDAFGYTKTTPIQTDPEEAWKSDDPKDQVVAVRAPSDPSLKDTTTWPPSPDTISHEIGHVLGLEEGYYMKKTFSEWLLNEEGTPTPFEGHPDDVMARPTGPVLMSTIRQVLRRQFGPDLDKRLKCPMALRSGPSELNLIMASISDVRLAARTEMYTPPGRDPSAPPEPSTFTGTFHAAGEYLTQLGLPIGASGALDMPVTFQVDLSHEPIDLRIDLGFWVLKQRLWWDALTHMPYAEGALQIEASGTTVDSSQFFPGPPLMAEFYDPDTETPTT